VVSVVIIGRKQRQQPPTERAELDQEQLSDHERATGPRTLIPTDPVAAFPTPHSRFHPTAAHKEAHSHSRGRTPPKSFPFRAARNDVPRTPGWPKTRCMVVNVSVSMSSSATVLAAGFELLA
jgi:hypothetical protein